MPSPFVAEIMKMRSNWAAWFSVPAKVKQGILRYQIYLIDNTHFLMSLIREPVDDRPRLIVEPFPRIDQHGDQIRIARATPCRLNHGPVEPASGREDAGCVNEHDLRFAVHRRSREPGCALSEPLV